MDFNLNELNLQIHPLLVSKIVQKILEYIPSHQYREFRKVNRIWNEESCKLIQGREVVTLCTTAKCAKYTKLFSRKSNSLIPHDFPYPHSRFNFPKVRMNLLYNTYVLRSFFDSFAPRVKHLNLILSRHKFKMRFLRILILQNLKHLESLTLNFQNFITLVPRDAFDGGDMFPLLGVTDLTVYGYGKEDHVRPVLAKILSSLPNLQRIEAGELQGRLLFDIIYGYGFKKSTRALPYLTHLEPSSVSGDLIDKLIQNQVHLKVLKGEVLRSVQESEIQTLLDYLASDIMELELGFPGPPNVPRFLEPRCRMVSLVKLEISRFEIDIMIFTNRAFPVLRTLKFSFADLVYDSKEAGTIFNSSLQLLTLNLCQSLTPDLITGFAKLFSNLRKLEIAMFLTEDREDLLAVIFAEFNNLEELRINDEIIYEDTEDVPKGMLESESRYHGFDLDRFREGARWIGDLKSIRI